MDKRVIFIVLLVANAGLSRPANKARRELSNAQLAEIKAAFKLFDKNGNGEISVDELGEAMKQAGQTVSEEELRNMIKRVDRNGNGKVEFGEFKNMLASHNEEQSEIKYAFNKFDKNGDGFINSDELALAMKALGETLSREEIDTMIDEADVDSDGKVSYAEFAKMTQGKCKIPTGEMTE